ncbi:TPM domain-containing protein [Paracidovorax wautersii]|uniref:TLP18.3, Psb32 and MOLO-1 founding protein of phosphatase n=1 Tax=Paracidovorax wautersii TaxID=1177982 RepID=A0A1I2GIZ8_9BURK|nr:TPM domain-containing protein [Paracidovorax wautersii]SFF17874.1 TLP18.3, Psb32 and MOLO-1 founding protein of phosphatase [Paracidovorax wautersii]
MNHPIPPRDEAGAPTAGAHAQPPHHAQGHDGQRPPLLRRLTRLVRHRWSDGAVRKAIPADLLERLTRRVAASERRHTGQIRLCIEGGLPWSYLRRGASPRERAVTLFGKLRVWDTEHNNGVLIYLLLADHAIEIVADRALARTITPQAWHAFIAQMRAAFREERYEDGLTQALAEVSALLVQHFPADDSSAPHEGAAGASPANELPDAPVLLRHGQD